jgi:uncharacterized protein YodC (DUF2158 family)
MLTANELEKLERQAIIAALFRVCDPRRTMENFNIGDTVQLKSGGPIMTISMTGLSGGSVQCAWFEENTLKHGVFHPATLKSAEPNEDGPFIA